MQTAQTHSLFILHPFWCSTAGTVSHTTLIFYAWLGHGAGISDNFMQGKRNEYMYVSGVYEYGVRILKPA